MFHTVRLVAAVAGLLGAAGCKGVPKITDDPADIKPALLIGPDATAKAPAPVELPIREGARLCLRTAQEYEKNGQTEDAIRLYEKARTSDPATAKIASRRLAVLYDKVGEFTKAGEEYNALMRANPHDADLCNDLGYSLYCRGDWANAEATLTKAVQIDSNHKKAWVNLGLARAQQGKWDESYEAFCKAVRPADAQCNIAFVLAAQGKTEEAKARYQLALTADPSLRAAQLGLTQLENPQPQGSGDPNKKAKRDPVEAAAQVPSIADLEARMKLGTLATPVGTPEVKELPLMPRE